MIFCIQNLIYQIIETTSFYFITCLFKNKYFFCFLIFLIGNLLISVGYFEVLSKIFSSNEKIEKILKVEFFNFFFEIEMKLFVEIKRKKFKI